MLHRTVSVSLRPGDALLFDGDLLHGTPPNDSRRRRRALQFHYVGAPGLAQIARQVRASNTDSEMAKILGRVAELGPALWRLSSLACTARWPLA